VIASAGKKTDDRGSLGT